MHRLTCIWDGAVCGVCVCSVVWCGVVNSVAANPSSLAHEIEHVITPARAAVHARTTAVPVQTVCSLVVAFSAGNCCCPFHLTLCGHVLEYSRTAPLLSPCAPIRRCCGRRMMIASAVLEFGRLALDFVLKGVNPKVFSAAGSES
jgi:hypothetical protein